MLVAPESASPPATRELPGRSLLGASLQVLITGAAAALVYSIATTGSRGGGVTGVHGASTVDLTLHPGPVVPLAMLVVYVLTVRRVIRRAGDEREARRMLTRAAIAIVAIALGSALVADLWFFGSPLAGWPHPGTWVGPFPFATQTLHVGHGGAS